MDRVSHYFVEYEARLAVGEKTIRIGPSNPTWRDQPVYESIDIVPLAQCNTFEDGSALNRPGGLIPSRQLVEYASLSLSLPSWNTSDSLGKVASIASAVPGAGNSESALFLRADILRKYMAETRSRLMWVVFGERQRLTESGMNAAYQQYNQVFLLEGSGIKKLYGKNIAR